MLHNYISPLGCRVGDVGSRTGPENQLVHRTGERLRHRVGVLYRQVAGVYQLAEPLPQGRRRVLIVKRSPLLYAQHSRSVNEYDLPILHVLCEPEEVPGAFEEALPRFGFLFRPPQNSVSRFRQKARAYGAEEAEFSVEVVVERSSGYLCRIRDLL